MIPSPHPRPARHRGIAWPLPVAALAFAATLAVYWPGYAMYDSVMQFRQALTGRYDDWHPPVMARLWSVLHSLVGGGTVPMLVLALATYWGGAGLIASTLVRQRRGIAAAVVIAIAACPLYLGWQVAVLKDAQLTGALVAVAGIAIATRRGDGRLPLGAVVGIVPLLIYAALVRANAVFAIAPLVILSLGTRRRPLRELIATLALILAVIAASGPINHRLMRAGDSQVVQTQALYDLAGIAVRAPSAVGTGLTPDERQALIARRCVRPYFWDPLGDAQTCGALLDRLRMLSTPRLYGLLATAIVHHPVAYAHQRLAHVNSTTRWLVPARWPGAAPPTDSEVNDLGLVTPASPVAAWLQRAGGVLAETPIGWPFAWAIVAAMIVAALYRDDSQTARVATALAASALTLEASFLVLSIASDLRYHLWPMIAAGLALVIGWPLLIRRCRVLMLGGGVLAAALIAGGVARATLPTPPQTYRGMLGLAPD